jgi:ABC-type phosphate/phosphonate transport system substrate-binding protein
MTRKIMLHVVALAILALTATACTKTNSSANANVNSSPGKNSSSSSGTSSTISKRFVGTWVEEDLKSDQGSRFTEDGKIIELSSNKTVGTYTTSGDDKATINMTEGGAATATLESDTRMKMVVGGETAYLTKKQGV